MGPITLITDFGDADHYVACMKGVILQRVPDARVIDVTHRIQHQDILAAAFVLRHVMPSFPSGTIHVAVVDPGVGSRRRILAGRYAGQTILAPDNGLVSLVHRDFKLEMLRSVENATLIARTSSATFQGRDIFAPVAGALLAGLEIDEVGPAVEEPVLLDIECPVPLESGGLRGRVLHVDHFGNLISNIRVEDLDALGVPAGQLNVVIGSTQVGPLRFTYSDVAVGEVLALIGSTGMVEVAIHRGHAASRLSVGVGTSLTVR
ncbi:MAG: S-adenosyl-l-methionine hydroxide adenosyltransferase family protein [Phycisphaerae bacterium]